MPAPVFILPTSGPRTYRGKFPNRARSVSSGAIGLHVELNDGTRLWTAKPRDHFADLPPYGHNMAGFRAKAVAMTDSQYDELKAAADLLATRVGIAGHGRRARLEETVRAMVNRIGAEIVSPVDPAPAVDRFLAVTAEIDTLYGDAPPVDPALEALGTLATAANEIAHCVPPGMARDELQAAIASAFALLNGGEPWHDDETPAPGYRYRDYPGQGEG